MASDTVEPADLSSTSPGLVARDQRRRRTEELLEQLRNEPGELRRTEILDDVVLVNRGVADSVAGRYQGRGLATEDLRQVAYEGLVKAVHRFDPEMGYDLLTFAVPTIRGELRRHFRDHGWVVRPPRRIQELQRRVSGSLDDLSHRLGRPPTMDELAIELGVDRHELDEAQAAFGLFAPASLDRPLMDGQATIGESLPDGRAEDDAEAAEARATLAPLLRRLPPRDRRVLYLRFVRDCTQNEIGDDLGITQTQVSRVLNRVLGQLRAQIA